MENPSRIGVNRIHRDSFALLMRTLGVAVLLACLALGFASRVAQAQIPVRVFHSPNDDGNFVFDSNSSMDPTDPTAQAESAVLPIRSSIERQTST